MISFLLTSKIFLLTSKTFLFLGIVLGLMFEIISDALSCVSGAISF